MWGGFSRGVIFFVFRNSVEKLCVSWALPLVECVAVWALKLPVPHTDVLKTHLSQSFSTELRKTKKITHHMGKAGLEPINPRRIEGPPKLMQPKSLQKQKELHPF